MKKMLLALLLVSIFFSCKEEEPIEELGSFNELNDKVLAMDVENLYQGNSEIFNVYAGAIRFNSDGTYQLLYDTGTSWMLVGSIYKWGLSGDMLTLESNRNEKAVTFALEVLNVNKDGLSVKEVNPELQYALRISNKQNVE